MRKYKIEGVAIRLIKERPIFSEERIDCSEKAIKVVGQDMEDLDREEVRIIMLDAKGKILGYNIVSVGTLDRSLISPRELFKPVFLMNAQSIILLHNHPSSEPEPSDIDVMITERINKICSLLGISFLDHIIVAAGEEYYSFAEKRMIKNLNYSDWNDFETNPNNLKGLKVAES